MRWTEVREFTLASLARALTSRALSPVEVTEACLERIDRLDGGLNSFITITADLAQVAARQAEDDILNGRYRGPLHGVPVALKDIFATKGIRTTAGSRVLRDWIPDEDAELVRRLTEAGAILLGKLNMSEFAYGSIHPAVGAPRNPWKPERFTGGSSSGSGAAVASALCFGSFGTDTGGSIRGPAAHCGIVGFKPSYEAISRAGVIPLSWSLDHVGPMARTVEDAAILFAAAGQAPWALRPHDEPLRRDIGDLRLGVASAYLGSDAQPEIAAAVRAAVAHLSSSVASVDEVSIPDDRQTVATWFSICMPEASAYHAASMKRCLQDYGEPLQDRLLAGLGVPGAQYVQAQRARHVIARQFAEVFRHVDIIALPAMQAEAPTIAAAMSGSWAGLRARLRSVAAFNVAGLPTATIPCGLTASGLPIGLQVVGAFQADWTVLRAAAAFEQSVGWNHRPEIW